MTNVAAELLASKRVVLLDFDGPVCSVFGGVGADTVAKRLREYLGLSEQHSTEASDPFEILRYAAEEGHREATEAEHELTKLEVEAVASATPTLGSAELLRVLADREQRVVVVSNNSATAVRAYLDEHRLTSLVYGVAARTEPDPALLKPNPFLLREAIQQTDAAFDQCVMVGDSSADIDAAHAVAVPVIAYANKQKKIAALRERAPTCLILHIYELYPPLSTASII